MKKLLSMMLVLAMLMASVSAVYAAGYTDIKNSPAREAILKLTELGVLEGYGDGTFHPEKNVTRAEMVKTILAALKVDVEEKNAQTQFEDVEAGKWYASYIKKAVARGIVEGKTPEIFDPNGNVTCDQAVTMIVRAMGFKESSLKGSYPQCFTDKADALGIMKGMEKGSSPATREQVAQLTWNMLVWANNNDTNEGITYIPANEYAVFTDCTEVADYQYKLYALQKGRQTDYLSEKNFHLLADHDTLYRLKFSKGVAIDAEAFEENEDKGLFEKHIEIGTKAVTLMKEEGLLQLADGSYTSITDNLVVYVYDGDEESWTVKTASYLSGLKQSDKNPIADIILFDTIEESSKPYEEYNYAIVLKNIRPIEMPF